MPIEFNCLQCDSMLRVQDSHAGKKARCPHCSNINTVPGSASTLTGSVLTSSIDRQSESSHPDAPSDTHSPEHRWSMKTPDGSVYGPVSIEELRQWNAEGRVAADCQVQREGETTWNRPEVALPGFHSADVQFSQGANAPQFASPANHPHAHGAGSFATPVSPSSTAGGRRYRPHNGVTILVLGIFGLLCCLPLAIASWIMGANELRAIKQGVVDPEGYGLAMAGMVLGIIACSIQGLYFLLVFASAIFG